MNRRLGCKIHQLRFVAKEGFLAFLQGALDPATELMNKIISGKKRKIFLQKNLSNLSKSTQAKPGRRGRPC